MINHNPHVLVTGGTGFLGKHLCKALEAQGHTVAISNRTHANLENYDGMFSYFHGSKFSHIFHLAAVTKAGDYCVKHPADQWVQNQVINTNILKYWRERQPQAKMIAMGTSCSYAPDMKMSEENYLLGEPEPSLYTYAMTKRMLLMGLKAIEKQDGLKWLYFVPSTLYGPGFELSDNHFIFDMIRNCYVAKTEGKPFTVWGDGTQRRELIYVRDAVEAMLRLADKVDNQVINLGSGQDNSINEFAEMVCSAVGYDPKLIGHDLTKYVGAKAKKIDTTKTERLLYPNRLVNTTLDVGLRNTVDYFVSETLKVKNSPNGTSATQVSSHLFRAG